MSLKIYNFLHSKVTSLDFTDIVAIACFNLATRGKMGHADQGTMGRLPDHCTLITVISLLA